MAPQPMKSFGAFSAEAAAQLAAVLGSLFNSISVTVGTLAINLITGASDVFLLQTGSTPGAQTTRTAAQLYADITAQFGFAPAAGFQYSLTIANSGAGTFTLTAGSGVTLTGTMTVAQNTTRSFVVTVTSATSLTITSVSVGTYS